MAAVACGLLCVDNALFEEKKASVLLEPRDEKEADFCLPPTCTCTCATAKPVQTAYSTAPTHWVYRRAIYEHTGRARPLTLSSQVVLELCQKCILNLETDSVRIPQKFIFYTKYHTFVIVKVLQQCTNTIIVATCKRYIMKRER